MNLAVPVLNLSEPGPVPQVKLHEDLKVTLWDRWEVKLGKDITLKQLFDHLESTYKIIPRDVLEGA